MVETSDMEELPAGTSPKEGLYSQALSKVGLPAEMQVKVGLSSEASAKEGYRHTRLGWIPEDWKEAKLNQPKIDDL